MEKNRMTCLNCKCVLVISEYLLCGVCVAANSNAKLKILILLEWKKNIEKKLHIVNESIDNVEETVKGIQGD